MFPLLEREKLRKSIRFLCHLYEQNRRATKNWPIFDRFVGLLAICIQLLVFMYTLAWLLAVTVPTLCYIFTDAKILMLPLYLPGTKMDSNSDYELNIICQAFFGFVGGAVYVHFDAFFITLLLHVMLLTDILCHNLRNIGKIANSKANEEHRMTIKLNLKNVIAMQNDLHA